MPAAPRQPESHPVLSVPQCCRPGGAVGRPRPGGRRYHAAAPAPKAQNGTVPATSLVAAGGARVAVQIGDGAPSDAPLNGKQNGHAPPQKNGKPAAAAVAAPPKNGKQNGHAAPPAAAAAGAAATPGRLKVDLQLLGRGTDGVEFKLAVLAA